MGSITIAENLLEFIGKSLGKVIQIARTGEGAIIFYSEVLRAKLPFGTRYKPSLLQEEEQKTPD